MKSCKDRERIEVIFSKIKYMYIIGRIKLE